MPDRREPPAGVLGVSRRPTRREWRRALVLFAVGMVGFVVVIAFVHPQVNLLTVGTKVPAVNLQSSTGTTVHPSGTTATGPYILEFFEAGCAHCQQVAGQLCGEKVPVFAVDAAKDSAATINAYRQQYAPACSYPMLLDPDLSASGAFGVSAVPTVYLVVDGRVAYAGAGLEGVSSLAAAVTKAIGG